MSIRPLVPSQMSVALELSWHRVCTSGLGLASVRWSGQIKSMALSLFLVLLSQLLSQGRRPLWAERGSLTLPLPDEEVDMLRA